MEATVRAKLLCKKFERDLINRGKEARARLQEGLDKKKEMVQKAEHHTNGESVIEVMVISKLSWVM